MANDGIVYCDAFMLVAFDEARAALAEGEVPVGCVFVPVEASCAANARLSSSDDCAATNQMIASRGRNTTNQEHHALAHAEFVAVNALLKSPTPPEDLRGYVLYVTVEPCIMCASMLLYNRVAKVFYGCGNPRFGGNGTVLSIHCMAPLGMGGYGSSSGHRANDAIELLQEFYRNENAAAPGHKRKRKSSAVTGDAGNKSVML